MRFLKGFPRFISRFFFLLISSIPIHFVAKFHPIVVLVKCHSGVRVFLCLTHHFICRYSSKAITLSFFFVNFHLNVFVYPFCKGFQWGRVFGGLLEVYGG